MCPNPPVQVDRYFPAVTPETGSGRVLRTSPIRYICMYVCMDDTFLLLLKYSTIDLPAASCQPASQSESGIYVDFTLLRPPPFSTSNPAYVVHKYLCTHMTPPNQASARRSGSGCCWVLEGPYHLLYVLVCM